MSDSVWPSNGMQRTYYGYPLAKINKNGNSIDVNHSQSADSMSSHSDSRSWLLSAEDKTIDSFFTAEESPQLSDSDSPSIFCGHVMVGEDDNDVCSDDVMISCNDTTTTTISTSDVENDTNGDKTSQTKLSVNQLYQLCFNLGLNLPEYNLVRVEGQIHSPIFTIRVVVKDYVCCEATDKTKKNAKQKAAAKALEQISSFKKIPTVSEKQSLLCDRPSTSMISLQKSPVSELQEFCAINKLNLPEYDNLKAEGESHAPTFTVQVIVKDKTLDLVKCEGKSATKKNAKQLAAANALDKLKKFKQSFSVVDGSETIVIDSKDAFCSVPDSAEVSNVTNIKTPISGLQEFCAINRISLPEYSLIRTEGQFHAPLFTIQVVIKDFVCCEATDKTKKNAKQKAAAKALEQLIIHKQSTTVSHSVKPISKPKPMVNHSQEYYENSPVRETSALESSGTEVNESFINDFSKVSISQEKANVSNAEESPIKELNEFCSIRKLEKPEFCDLRTEGKSHAPTFTVQVTVKVSTKELKCEGVAKTKKSAKRQAALLALEQLRTLPEFNAKVVKLNR